MLFTSYEFLAFLAIFFLLYYLVPKKTQWMVLLVASYLFYFLSGVRYLAFILTTTVLAYFVARALDATQRRENDYLSSHRDELDKEARKAYKACGKKKRFRILTFGLLVGFGILAVLKYTAFTVVNINSILHSFGAEASIPVPSLLLPLGISFYTFQTMGYLIDVYRGRATAEKNFFRLALFVSFFPQLIQGPISRFSDLGEQLYSEHRFSFDSFFSGAQRILWGYFKKLVIADRLLAPIKAMTAEPDVYDGGYVFLLIILYSVQIYADFSGGIDITIGIAESLGIKLRENFIHPFTSKSTKEYWNRWHITMGSWFTDYVFYPISICRPMQSLSKWCRKSFGNSVGKRIPVYLATVVTWYLTGLWHGAGWNFIVWGLLNCLVILASQELEPLYRKFHKRFPSLEKSRPYGAFMIARTFLLMGLIRSLDLYRSVPTTFSAWGTMFSFRNWSVLLGRGLSELGLDLANIIILVFAVAFVCLINASTLRCENIRERLAARPALSFVAFAAVLAFVILFGAYGVGYDASQFIYNQF